ncbi:RNA polymerase sigma factor [Nocardioides sp. GXQ0305]|uniref:RNA polymerase sigma factor n=1 Tax=Nocardioides sp. GXQ0305 TaxID=3423912 RepID=UPI003D7C7B64
MRDDEASPVPLLVAAAAAGEAAAWHELVARYTALVLSVVRRHRLRDDDAEDVVQTVWLRLVEHLDELREPAALPGWIGTTARNECLRVIRARRVVPSADPFEHPAAAGADVGEETFDATLLDAERHEALLSAMAELPDRQRALLALLIEDPPVPYEEVSARLGIPVGSIGPTRARALARLRAHPAVSALLDG